MPNRIRPIRAHTGPEERFTAAETPIEQMADVFADFSTLISTGWTVTEEANAQERNWAPIRPNEETR